MIRRRAVARSRFALRAAIAACALGGALGCSKKASAPSAPAPEITGLAAVPATAEVVVGADVAKLAGSPVIERAVDQLLLHNAALGERWQRVQADCKLDITKQVKRVMLAIGPHRGPEPGTGPVIMVVVGSIPESDLKDCVGRMIGTGGGNVTGKTVAGRTLYLAKDGNRTMYFGYGRPDTIVLGSNEAFVTEALGTGAKAPENPDLTTWLKLVNQNAALWAVGRTDARVRDGLVKVTQGKLTSGPVAFAATADLADGAKLQLGAVMSTNQDAKSLESYVKGELGLLTAAAQWKSLGAVVGKISVSAEKDVVQFRVPLTVADLNQLLSALDGDSAPAQDSAPPTPGIGVNPSPSIVGPGSGSGTK
jgi:hypothetical protein